MLSALPVLRTLREQSRGLTRDQRGAMLAAWLGWAMDSFDYFLLVFVLGDVARDLHSSKTSLAFATTLTLIARPVGALVFGVWADKVGRRLPLMADVLFYSLIEFLTGWSSSLGMLLALRFLYGVGMGGEWGLGASLALEKLPPDKRGFWSGVLQQGYSSGYLFAAVAYFVLHPLGWRVMFMIGAIPALIVLLIRVRVGESEAWERTTERVRVTRVGPRQVFFNPRVLRRFVYLVLLMGAFNFMSHGTQDFFPQFLSDTFGVSSTGKTIIAIIYNVGAIIGCTFFGALSERYGRRRMAIICVLCAIPMAPLYSYAPTLTLITVGMFLIQAFTQGAWGVIPAHLTEMSPDEVRGFYPGVTYQLGNLLASLNLPLQTALAQRHGGRFALLVVTVPACAVTICLLLAGRERHGVKFGSGEAD